MSGKRSAQVDERGTDYDPLVIEAPDTADGAALWRIARDSGKLDLNSSYSYLLWCRDFSDTSIVARRTERGEDDSGADTDTGVVGFVTGYVRPSAADTLVVWQVAVDTSARGRGLAAAMLDALLRRVADAGVRYLETTVTADNVPSNRMFTSLARRWNAPCARTELFCADEFPDGHETEFLYRIGPLEPIRDHAFV